MRITVDIDDETLANVISLTGESVKSKALAKAAEEFVRRRTAREFGRLIREGAFDYGVVSEGSDEDPTNPVPPLILE